jgi:hypothetical protein
MSAPAWAQFGLLAGLVLLLAPSNPRYFLTEPGSGIRFEPDGVEPGDAGAADSETIA